jgi:hypothetical protein
LLSRFPEKWRTRVLPWRKPPWARGFPARKIFIMLFLMLGPLNILVPFITLTGNSERVLRRRLATRAIVFSMAALALAGLFGRNILDISRFGAGSGSDRSLDTVFWSRFEPCSRNPSRKPT